MAKRRVTIDRAELLERSKGNRFWREYLCSPGDRGVHLAVFNEPLLGLVLDGRKTVESRFSRVRCAPYGDVHSGDLVLVKSAGGPVCGMVLVEKVSYFDLSSRPIEAIRKEYGDQICADDAFWMRKRSSQFATLIGLGSPIRIEPLACSKRDRRGWVLLTPRQQELF